MVVSRTSKQGDDEMTKFTATFTTGDTITRNSDNSYAFAWAVIRMADDKIEKSGFSADRANAAKAAQGQMWSFVSARDKKNAALRRYHAGLAKTRGFTSVAEMYAQWDADAAAHNAARRVEIVIVA
jgi:hypothetical protein